MSRISQAIHKFAPPDVEWDTFARSEFCLIQGVGAADRLVLEECLAAGKKVLMFLHCYRSADCTWGDTLDHCHLVASYLDLPKVCGFAGNFLHTAYGYDPDTFHPLPLNRTFQVFTTGHVAATECIDKVWEACKQSNLSLYHTGKRFGWESNYIHLPLMDDASLCRFLNQLNYVTCLRTIEGFEMLGVEGLACGVRPIYLQLPCYQWYEEHGYAVDPAGDIVGQLQQIITTPPRPLGPKERQSIREKFAWPPIASTFFSRITSS